MPEFDLDSSLSTRPNYRCAQCGAPLIYGGWKNYFEYYELDPDTGQAGVAEGGRDNSEGDRVMCSASETHDIGWTDEQREAFDEEWG